jgi:hypothetical protein
MAVFNEIGAGGSEVAGCAIITYIDVHQTLFAARDIVFNITKAKRGVLEKIVIKKVKIINSKFTYGQFEVMYVDTYNALWNEWDLVSHATAIALSTAYYEDLLVDLDKLKVC